MPISTRSTPEPPSSRPSPVPQPAAQRAKWRVFLPFPTGKALGVWLLATLTLITSVLLIELPVLHHTQGDILFPLDGAYVNITVGRNLAFYQVWGVSRYAFQSAASSLLYPLTLAPIFFIFGAHLIIPLIVNFLAAAYFLLMLQRTLIRYGASQVRQLFVLIGVMALTLLPLLAVSGMEYTLQLLFVFLFMDALVQMPSTQPTTSASTASVQKALTAVPASVQKAPTAVPASASTAPAVPKASAAKSPTAHPAPPKAFRNLCIFGLLAVAARYEDLLVIALASILLGLQKGWKPAAKLAVISISPVVVFGIISLLKKSYFLPNSMLVGPYPTYSAILALIATTAVAWLIIRHSTLPPKPQPLQTNHASRPAQTARELPPSMIPILAILILLLVPFTARNAANLAHFTQDCDRTYDEQYLTANFVHLYYFRQTVGTNQPGAVSYFSEGRKLDYTGNASNDVIRLTKKYGWTPLYADSLSKKDGIRVAIVADPWFRADQFPKWTRVATWDIAEGPEPAPSPSATANSKAAPNSRATTNSEPAPNKKTVNFYAVEAYDTTWLRKRLREYQHLLPPTVSVRYY